MDFPPQLNSLIYSFLRLYSFRIRFIPLRRQSQAPSFISIHNIATALLIAPFSETRIHFMGSPSAACLIFYVAFSLDDGPVPLE